MAPSSSHQRKQPDANGASRHRIGEQPHCANARTAIAAASCVLGAEGVAATQKVLQKLSKNANVFPRVDGAPTTHFF